MHQVAHRLAVERLELDDDPRGLPVLGDDHVREEGLAEGASCEVLPIGCQGVLTLAVALGDRACLQRPHHNRGVEHALRPPDVRQAIQLPLQLGDELERGPILDGRADVAPRTAEHDQDVQPAVELLEEVGKAMDCGIVRSEVGGVPDLARELGGLERKPQGEDQAHRSRRQRPSDADLGQKPSEARYAVEHGRTLGAAPAPPRGHYTGINLCNSL